MSLQRHCNFLAGHVNDLDGGIVRAGEDLAAVFGEPNGPDHFVMGLQTDRLILVVQIEDVDVSVVVAHPQERLSIGLGHAGQEDFPARQLLHLLFRLPIEE